MKICLNTSTIKPVPILEKIKLVGEAGYAGIELWLNDVWEFVARGGEVSEISRALDDHGLIVPSVIAMRQWGDFEGWEHQLVLDEARRRFALGARLGAPYIVATPRLKTQKLLIWLKDTKNYWKSDGRKGLSPLLNTLVFLSQYIP